MNPINNLNLCNPERYYSTQSTKVEELPIDLLTKIFEFLHLKEFASLNILNKNFYDNICVVEDQHVWLISKFQETLHLKFQNDRRKQYIRTFQQILFYKNLSCTTDINVPSNKIKEKYHEKIITFPENTGLNNCKQANEFVKIIFSAFLGHNIYEALSQNKQNDAMSIKWRRIIIKDALDSSRSEDEVANVLLQSFVFLADNDFNTRHWLSIYCKSKPDSSLAKCIFDITKASTNPNINKGKILCACLSKNEELFDEAYKIAYQIFESDYDDKLLVQCIKTNPKLALEVFEKYKSKLTIRVFNLLAACAIACPEKLPEKFFAIAKKKLGKSPKLKDPSLELLITCIKANLKYFREGFDLVRSIKDSSFISVFLRDLARDDPTHACPAIYEYLEKSINKVDFESNKVVVHSMFEICVKNELYISNFFECVVKLLIKIKPLFFDNIIKLLLQIISVSPLDNKRFDLLFKLSFFDLVHPNKSDLISVFCDAHLLLAEETIKNIKKLGNENDIVVIFFSLLKRNPNLAQLIFKEIDNLVNEKQTKCIKQNLKCMILDEYQLKRIPEISKYIHGEPSFKRKLEVEVGKNKEVRENEPEIDKYEPLDLDGFPMNFFD